MYSHREASLSHFEQFYQNKCNLFFKKLQPLLLFGKLLGICSVKIFIDDFHLLSHDRTNFCVIFFTLVRIGLCSCSMIKLIFDKQLDIEECLANVSNILATVLCLRTDGILVKMILKISRIDVSQKRNEKCVYGGIFICVVLSIHLCRVSDYVSNQLDLGSEFPYTKFLMIIYHNCTCVLIIVQFLMFIFEIRRQFEYLNEIVEVMLIKKIASERDIELYRHLYEELICIVEDLNSSIGMRLLIPIVAIPTDLLAYFYRFVFEKKWQLSVLDFTILIVYFFGVHCICSAGSEMKKMVS